MTDSDSSDRIKRDRVFDEEGPVTPFEFNETVAGVFDDMADRSIPYYATVQKMITELACRFYQPGSALYDLGCSTGTTLLDIMTALGTAKGRGGRFIGVDSSEAMCRKAQEKLAGQGAETASIVQGDITELEMHDASVVIMNYTLQFIDPLRREALVRRIHDNLRHKGILLVSDKTAQSSTDISRIFVDFYYNLKRRNGYSELEIARKREALENVLIPYSVNEERELFARCGFAHSDLFFTWYNFSSFICVKE